VRIFLDYIIIMLAVFVAWYLASCTRRLLGRLKEPELKGRREFIVLRPTLEEPPLAG